MEERFSIPVDDGYGLGAEVGATEWYNRQDGGGGSQITVAKPKTDFAGIFSSIFGGIKEVAPIFQRPQSQPRPQPQKPQTQQSQIPWTPIAIGAGVLVLAGLMYSSRSK